MAVQGCTGRPCNTLQQLKVSGGLARLCKMAQTGRATHCFHTYFLLLFLSANQSLARPGCARLHGRARQTDHLKYEFHEISYHFMLSPLVLFFFLRFLRHGGGFVELLDGRKARHVLVDTSRDLRDSFLKVCCGEGTLLWKLEVLVVFVLLHEFVLFAYGSDSGGYTDVLQV